MGPRGGLVVQHQLDLPGGLAGAAGAAGTRLAVAEPSVAFRGVSGGRIGGAFLAGLALVPPAAMEPSGAPTASPLATMLGGGGQIGLTVGLLLGGFALVVRLRRASGEERQQLRWITVAAGVAASALVAMVAHNLARSGNVAADWRLALLLSLGVLGVPVATGFAVLRYRLYDFDVVIGAAVKAAVFASFVTGGYVAVVTTTAGCWGVPGRVPSRPPCCLWWSSPWPFSRCGGG